MQSQAFEKSILRWGGRQEKLRYVPNWFKQLEQKSDRPEWLAHLPSGFRIIFAGNIGKAQDMATMVKAAEILREHKDIHWIIVGDGSDRNFAETEVAQKNLEDQVHFYGRRSPEDMPALFSLGDVMLVSLTDEKIFSLTVPAKIQAYMANKRPIIAALNGEGARIVLDAGAGLACPAMNPERLAESVLQMKRRSAEDRAAMGLRGFAYFKSHFEDSLIISQIEKLCQESIQHG